MKDESTRLFKEKLDSQHDWPTEYTFKFIVPKGKEQEIQELFPLDQVLERQSSKGNYISMTIKKEMPSSDAVINVYLSAHKIEGIIAL